MESQPSTHDEAAETPPESAPVARSRLALPLPVAIAGLILALLLSGLILVEIAPPLAELVFGNDPDIPIPEGATVLSTEITSGRSEKEWLYGTDMTGCEVIRFYADQGATCQVTPFACAPDQRTDMQGIMQIGICGMTEKGSVTDHAWDIYVSSNFPDGAFTRFRVSLFK